MKHELSLLVVFPSFLPLYQKRSLSGDNYSCHLFYLVWWLEFPRPALLVLLTGSQAPMLSLIYSLTSYVYNGLTMTMLDSLLNAFSCCCFLYKRVFYTAAFIRHLDQHSPVGVKVHLKSSFWRVKKLYMGELLWDRSFFVPSNNNRIPENYIQLGCGGD